MQIDHFRYPQAESFEKADGAAWVMTSKDADLVLYPFNFPELEPKEIRAKILYTSICQSDILTVRELWGPCEFPCCPGHEIVASITLVGQEVTDRKVGEIVGVTPIRYSCEKDKCSYCANGETNLCDQRVFLYNEGYYGGYSTHIQIDSKWTIPFPAGIQLDKAAPILCAGLTVYAPLKRHGSKGKTCAVLGIGGLGHMAILYANKLGMKVTAFTTKTNAPEQFHKLGAMGVQHSTNLEQLRKNEGKYDVVINTLFISEMDIFLAHQRLTAPGGAYIAVGLPPEKINLPVDIKYMTENEITLAGSLVASIEDAADTLRFSADYGVLPIVQKFAFEDFNKALHRAEKENPRFRCVVDVATWAKANGFDK